MAQSPHLNEVRYVNPFEPVIVGLDTNEKEEALLYDERIDLPVDEAMVRSIMVYGIQDSIICREEAGVLYVVSGRQRVRAAREAHKRQGDAGEHKVRVPVVVKVGDDARIVGIMNLTNEIRRNDPILTKAKKAARLLGLSGDLNEVAIAFGRSLQTIRNWMSLVEAHPDVHKAIEAETITPAAAIELARMLRAEQASAVADLIKKNEKRAPASEAQARGARGVKVQPGVKRTWVRAALNTDAAKKLDTDQRVVLEWIVEGHAPKGSWMDTFVWEAEGELEEGKKTKKAQKAAKAKAKADDGGEVEVATEVETEVETEVDGGGDSEPVSVDTWAGGRSRNDLRKLAKLYDVEGYAKMTKTDLANAVVRVARAKSFDVTVLEAGLAG